MKDSKELIEELEAKLAELKSEYENNVNSIRKYY